MSSMRDPLFDDDRRMRLERVLGLARLGLALVGILLLQADAEGLSDPGLELSARLLAAYSFFALVAAVVVALFGRVIGPLAVVLHTLDIAWVVAVTPLTDRSATLFFVIALFAVIGAAFRWGLTATALTGGAIAVLSVAQGSLAPLGGWTVPGSGRLALRAAYVAGMAYLIGALAEEQHQARRQAATIARVLATVNLAAGLRASMRPLLAELAGAFGASRATLAVQEIGSGRVYLWTLPAALAEVTMAELDDDRRRIWWTALPGASPIKLIDRRAGGFRLRVGPRVRHADATLSAALDVQLSGARRALVGEWQITDEWGGRLFLYDPAWWGKRHQQWLSSLLPQVGSALYSLYLLARLRSRATAMERARVARELHDGVIQTLIGLELHVETLRREVDRTGSPLASELEAIRETLRASALNTRELMQQLKPVDLGVGDLPGRLASTADRFRRDTSIDTNFVCDLHDVQIAPRVGREILRIAQEALVNVRKHSGASHVVLRFGAEGDHWRLTVDDDGQGFDFAGRYSLDQLDAERRGPVVIKERVRGLGGTLTVDSAPGCGTRLEVEVPRSPR